MRTKASTGKRITFGAAVALIAAFTLVAGARTALAVPNQAVLCQGAITSAPDSTSVPAGPTYSVGTVVVVSENADCAKTTTTITQVTQATCTVGTTTMTPCITTMTETNAVPLDPKPGCGKGNNTPGITVSTITASSNNDLVTCQQTSAAETYSSLSAAYTMVISPISGPSACKAAGTGGVTGCASLSQ